MRLYIKPLSPLFCATLILSLFLASCKKTEHVPQVDLVIPTDLSIPYGSDTTIHISSPTGNSDKITYSLAFDEATKNIKLRNGNLLQTLEQAVTLNQEKGDLKIQTGLLFPNGATSVSSDVIIPEIYRVKVIAKSNAGNILKEEDLSFKILPGKITFQDVDQTSANAFTYRLFSNKETYIALDSTVKIPEGSQLQLPKSAASTGIKITDNQLVFPSSTGNLSNLEEKSYTVEPALIKDGFPVASRKLKVTFIPQIKFFYGSYYPEYDVTVKTPLLNISLYGGFQSQKPVFYPEKYRSSFSIVKIEKDGEPFEDTDKLFAIKADLGIITVKTNKTLQAGQYKIFTKAVLTTGMELFTDLTLAMKEGD